MQVEHEETVAALRPDSAPQQIHSSSDRPLTMTGKLALAALPGEEDKSAHGHQNGVQNSEPQQLIGAFKEPSIGVHILHHT